MGKFWKKLFSKSFRLALKAEAAGNYREAAGYYALCNEKEKVAQMNINSSHLEKEINKKIALLKTALEWIEIKDEKYNKICIDIAQLYEKSTAGKIEEEKNEILIQAASMYEKSGEFKRAGDIYLSLNLKDKAASCYEKGGDIEKLEHVMNQSMAEEKNASLISSLFEEYKNSLNVGNRKIALEKLNNCIEVAGERKKFYLEELINLKAKLINSNLVNLSINNEQFCFAGKKNFIIGRGDEADFKLKEPSVSRRHCEIIFENNVYFIRDCGSSKGTKIGTISIANKIKLPDECVVSIGELCKINLKTLGGNLFIEVIEGLDCGRKVFMITEKWKVLDGMFFCFEDVFPVLQMQKPYEMLLNNQKILSDKIYLLKNDNIILNNLNIRVIN